MARNTKKKLAILAGTSKCLLYAEAKFCASEMPGEVKYYECLKTEYCCAFGCCVSPGFHFHHLWYYWLLVIIMFLVCSGGGWWYRYWLQGRYRAAASAIPSRPSNARAPTNLRGPSCQVQQARITYNSARNTVLLQRMWKGPQRNGTSPAVYNGSNATTSTHYQNMSVVLNDSNCPYYQLYGPPPSYETVIAQTRGKIASPEHSASARAPGQTGNVLQSSPGGQQCYVYPCSPSARYNVPVDQPVHCQNGPVGPRSENQQEEFVFPHFSQHCMANGGARQNFYCVPFEYQPGPTIPGTAVQSIEAFSRPVQSSPKKYVLYNRVSKSSDTSDAETPAQGNDLEDRAIVNPGLNSRGDRSSSPESSDTENGERRAILSADAKGQNAKFDQSNSKNHGRTEAKYTRGKHRDREREIRQKQREEIPFSPSSFRSRNIERNHSEDLSRGSENLKRSFDVASGRRFSTFHSGGRYSFNKRQRSTKCENENVIGSYCFASEGKLLREGILEGILEGVSRQLAGSSQGIDGRKALTISETEVPVSCSGQRRERSSPSEVLASYGCSEESTLRLASCTEIHAGPRQSNPSNNVILPSSSRNAEKQKGRSPAEARDHCDLESKCKLDRSKSLD